jgi:photosystem II stability/assembly factor-like uncharacterized protein
VGTGRLGAVHFFSARVGVGVTTPFTGRCSGAPIQLPLTRDGGQDWTAVGRPLPVRAGNGLDTVALVASSASRVWILTGRGQVLSTADEGRGWRIEPLPTPVVQLALTNGSMWALSCVARGRRCQTVLEHAQSASGGWDRVALPRLPAGAFGDLAVPSTRVVAVNVPEGQDGLRRELLISTDGGRHWTSRRDPRTPGREPMQSCDGPITSTARDWWLLCATGAGMNHSAVALEHTTDGGHRWSTVSSVTDLSAPIPRGVITPLSIEALAAGSPTRLWLATTVAPVFESADAGARWRQAQGVNDGGAIGVSFDVLSATTAWLVAPGTGLWRTTDGRHWQSLNARPLHASEAQTRDTARTAPCAPQPTAQSSDTSGKKLP